MNTSLKARMIRAATWLVGASLMSQLMRLGSNLILTRLLMPEAFGLVAAVNTLYFALVMFSDLGVWQSVVKSEHGMQPRFLGTAWSVQLLRGGLLAVVIVLLAAALQQLASSGMFAADTVYADSRLPAMVLLFALCALVQGLESMKLAVAQRELRGAELARLEMLSQIGSIVATVTLAALTRSVWALPVGTLVGAVLRTALSHGYLSGPTPRPCWDRDFARDIVGFGKWIFVSSIIGFLAAHGEKIILGGSLTIQNFGIFSIASTLMAAIIGVYGSLNGHVIFSSLSHALRSDDPAEVRRVYTRVQQLADGLLGLLAGGLLMSGHWMVQLLYDGRYQDAGWMLQALSLGLLAMRHQVIEQLMFARGQPAWVSANNTLRALGLWICIPAGYTLYGESGAIAGVVLSQFWSWPLSLRFKYREGLLTRATECWWLPALALGMLSGWGLDRLLAHYLN